MLSYDELINVLKTEGIDTENYEIESVRKLYGGKLADDKLTELIDIMILVTVDIDTPIYDILEFITTLESDNKIDENYTCAPIIIDIIIDNLLVNAANCERLLDLIKDSDIVAAYNTLINLYSDTLPTELKELLFERAKKLFAPELLLF